MRFIVFFVEFIRGFSLVGFGGVPVYFVIRDLYRDVCDPYFWLRASAMSYSFFFAIFPTVILIFSLVPYVPIRDFEGEVGRFLGEWLPLEGYELIRSTLRGVFVKQGLGVISITFLIIFFSATRGVSTLIQAFSKVDPILFKKRGFWRENLLSLYIFLVLFVLTLLSILTSIVGEIILHYFEGFINNREYNYNLLLGLNWLISLLVLYLAVCFLYYQAPSTRKRWNFFSTGAFVASFFIFVAQLGLRYYFANFGSYNKIYGSLTAVMILMVWFYWNSVCLLLGFELNHSIDKAQHRQGEGSKG